MTVFADYEYYLSKWAGSLIPAREFDTFEQKAARMVKYLAGSNLTADTEITDEIKNAVCAAAEAAYELNLSLAKIPQGVKSEGNDGATITYQDNDYASVREKTEQLMYAAIKRELAHTGLLYRGVR